VLAAISEQIGEERRDEAASSLAAVTKPRD
jgi:hypothetical protein